MTVSENPNTITQSLIKNAGINAGMRVLDFGCGNGETSRLLAAAVGPEGAVVGIDINPSAVTQAKAKVAQEGFDNCEFVHADIIEA